MAVTPTSLRTNIAVGTTGQVAEVNTLHGAVNALTAEFNGAQMNLRTQAGVVGDGTTDDASAINTAATAAASLGVRLFASGTFRINSTVTLTCDADLSGATFNYYGSSVAVQIGTGVSAAILFRKNIALPKIVEANKGSGTGWTSGTIGVKATNMFGCVVWSPQIKGFETGLYMYGLGTGNVYNEVHVLHSDNNKRGLVLGAGTAGWSNSNAYHLGILAYNSAEGSSIAGARAILTETATNLVNGNWFYGGSVEGDGAEFHLEDNGLYNIYDGIRWENASGCRIKWGATAARNEIRGGYAAQSIIETHTAGSVLNRVVSTGMSRIVGSTSKAVQWLENTGSSAAFVDAVMDPAATVAGSDAATAYRVARSGDATKMKRAADAFDRMILDHVNGRIYLGDGTAAPTTYLQYDSAGLWKLNGASLYPVTHNTTDLGINATRWRYVRAGTAVITGAFATGSRPAATVGAGAMIFDTTLGKPIWSDGTNWKDATGTNV
jgi:hypothetical protein